MTEREYVAQIMADYTRTPHRSHNAHGEVSYELLMKPVILEDGHIFDPRTEMVY